MGRFFSDAVEQAIQYIYCDLRAGKGQEGMRLLEEASAGGDADAHCLLARCLYGPDYTWPGHHFPENERRGDKLMRRSVEEGSALGAIVALRCGMMSSALERGLPEGGLAGAFEKVLEKARQGEPFCQMVVGHAYFWQDFLRIEGKKPQDFASQEEFRQYLIDRISRCEEWYWKCFRGGLAALSGNLSHFYREGVRGPIPPRPEKEIEVNQYGARQGYPNYQCFYADDLYGQGKRAEAFELYRQSAQAGEPRALFWAGYSYDLGNGVPVDKALAARYYQRALADPSSPKGNASNRLGILCYEGTGVEQDYAKAFQLFKQAERCGASPEYYYLGACYANGQGTRQDGETARRYLEKVDWNCPSAFFLLGRMYGRGEGGAVDIPRAVEYLKKAGDLPEAREELRHYKKTLFGKWVRR